MSARTSAGSLARTDSEDLRVRKALARCGLGQHGDVGPPGDDPRTLGQVKRPLQSRQLAVDGSVCCAVGPPAATTRVPPLSMWKRPLRRKGGEKGRPLARRGRAILYVGSLRLLLCLSLNEHVPHARREAEAL